MFGVDRYASNKKGGKRMEQVKFFSVFDRNKANQDGVMGDIEIRINEWLTGMSNSIIKRVKQSSAMSVDSQCVVISIWYEIKQKS